ILRERPGSAIPSGPLRRSTTDRDSRRSVPRRADSVRTDGARRQQRVLRDRLCPRPRIMFVGINPSLTSAEVGHHFAGPGNPVWRLLAAAGLIPDAFTFADDVRLPPLGLAITNIVPRATRSAAELTPGEYEAGR